MILPYLADELFTEFKEDGVKVFWRPPDLEDKAKWADRIRREDLKTYDARSCVLGIEQQITRIEGLKIKDGEGERDYKHPEDFKKYYPLRWVMPVWNKIDEQWNLSESEIKN